MADRPILFSAPMIRAILEGRKSATRRVLKSGWAPENRIASLPDGPNKGLRVIPYATGDMLWVREAFSYSWAVKDDPERRHYMPCWYWADGNPIDGDWSKPKPSIHMPRWASRITLRVTAVKVERLQDISEEDAKAEGCEEGYCTVDGIAEGWSAKSDFQRLWESIHGPGAWEANPWVAAISFERVKP